VAGLTLDAGALIAYERAAPRVSEILALAFARGAVPTVPAIALAEVWCEDARVAMIGLDGGDDVLHLPAADLADRIEHRVEGEARRGRWPGLLQGSVLLRLLGPSTDAGRRGLLVRRPDLARA
jgi:hypothetical protein